MPRGTKGSPRRRSPTTDNCRTARTVGDYGRTKGRPLGPKRGRNDDLSARLETSLGFTTKENEEDKGSDNFKDQLALMEREQQEQEEILAIMAEQKKYLLAKQDAKEGRSMNDRGVSVSRLETRQRNKEDKGSDYRKDQLALMDREQKEQMTDLLARLDAKEGRSRNDRGISVSRLENTQGNQESLGYHKKHNVQFKQNFRCPILKPCKSNVGVWTIRMKFMLKQYGNNKHQMLKIVLAKPTKKNWEDEEWKDHNDEALTMIQQYIHDSHLARVQRYKSANEYWKELQPPSSLEGR